MVVQKFAEKKVMLPESIKADSDGSPSGFSQEGEPTTKQTPP
jgi:hypothetical protein